ncbi:MAG TPA: DUF2206 domain-containing protein [Streptosporangiaceae bacterium]|nr:DUF2206 domain-containing protein [Streptosporangiaceae bacterium]
MHDEREIVAADLPPLPAEMTSHSRADVRDVSWRDFLPAEFSWAMAASACLVLIVNIFVIASLRLPPFIGPALGFWFLVLQPVYLLCSTSLWGQKSVGERVGLSLASVLLFLMLAGLAADLILPFVGLKRPLDPIPVVGLGDLLTIAAYMLRRRYPAERTASFSIAAIKPEECRLVLGSVTCVALAVLGANRLNNGAGDQLSLAALVTAVLTLVFLLLWRHRIREATANVVVYLLSLSLLLMTSLRGWFVTGHDIQTEYQVFQLTIAHGRWDIAQFHNAYNACLSITILPAELARVIGVADPYIYKVFFQLIFAACPVLVYTIARRYWSVPVAMLASIFFISFPTFLTDMPFINRQEIALLFVAVAVLVVTNESWGPRTRAISLIVACLGVEVSHYSSMYIFLATMLVAWIVQATMRLRHRYRRSQAAHAVPPPWAQSMPTIDIRAMLAVCVLTVAWGYLATQSAGAVLADAKAAISGLLGHSTGARSNNVGYSLLFWRTPTNQQVLNDYTNAALKLAEATRRDTSYIAPPSAVSEGNLRAVKLPLLPLTSTGRLLSGVGVPVTGLNTVIRLTAAQIEQLFVGAGIIALLFVRRLRKQVGWEFFCLSVGSVVVLVAVTILPDLSVDYGVLRVFQQALIIIAPVLVAGAFTIFKPLGDRWAAFATAAVCLGIFISTTGLLPQVLGGYPAQLSLNNSGQYYSSYYMNQQDEAGVQWLSGQSGVLPSGIQATHFSNKFLFGAPSEVTGQQFIEDAFPPLLRQHAWVVLDYPVLHTDVATASYDGDLIAYKYPLEILDTNKNLVYNNGDIEIYR